MGRCPQIPHPLRQVTVDGQVLSQHKVNSDWSNRGVSFRAKKSQVKIKFDGIDSALASSGQGSVFLDDVHVMKISDTMFTKLNTQCNLLKNTNLDTGW